MTPTTCSSQNKKKIVPILILVGLLVGLCSLGYLQVTAANPIRLVRSVWGTSGAIANSSSYRLQGTFGQSAIGIQYKSNSTYQLTSGYWSGIPQLTVDPPPPSTTATVAIPTKTPPVPTWTMTPIVSTPTPIPSDWHETFLIPMGAD